MKIRSFLLAFIIGSFACSAPSAAEARHDYANRTFVNALDAALRDFYARNFDRAQSEFEQALSIIPDNTLAISFLHASAAHAGDALESLTNAEEDAVGKAPKDYVARVRLGFAYLFAVLFGLDKTADARDEFNTAVNIDPDGQAARVGLGIMRENERSANRAKVEFLAALRVDPDNVLAREYLASIYQIDLRDPQAGLKYAVDVPNLLPAYADIEFHLASIMDDLKQYDAAVAYARQGIALDTGRVGEAGQYGYTLVAEVLLKQNKVSEAKKYLEQAVVYDADGIYARKLLDKIAKGDYDDKTNASGQHSKR